MRVDRLLVNLRFLRTRSLAARLIETGHLRRNGLRILRASQDIVVGDVLTIPLGERVRLVEVLLLPEKRGPAREAQACYRVLDQTVETDIGAEEHKTARGKADP